MTSYRKKGGFGLRMQEQMPRTIKVSEHQTGKPKSRNRDKRRRALPPGKRVSRTGKIYWENRRNRSDMPGTTE